VGVGLSRRSETSEAGIMELTMEAGTENASGTKQVLEPVVKIDEGRI
jgi:hypothetical protein